MNFRYDINGLRAIAVIAVVLFHFKPAWVPGGFAGVDVFFVISGFLMTGIIFRGLDNDNFSLLKFYVARANRIIPALAVLCAVLLVLGWFFLTPVEYKALGKHAGSSMSFLSNVIYWKEAGYFDAASHEKWLLHTWSLSAEWQFYLIYPIVLLVFKKFLSLDNLKRLIIIGTALSFGISVIATMKWPNAAYYLLPTRAWEMMMGGVAFLYPWNTSEAKKKFLEVSGLLLILFSYIFVSSNIPWPGHSALIPVLGSYLIIIANQQSSLITNNKLFQKLGKWSYSIYLWHWPFVVTNYYFSLNEKYIYIGIILSVFSGFLSYTYIERIKFENNFVDSLSYLKCKPLHIALMGCILSMLVFFNTKYFYSMPNEILNAVFVSSKTDENNRYTWDRVLSLDKKKHFKDVKYKVLTIGDSQSGDFVNFLFETDLNSNVDVISRIIQSRCEVFSLDDNSLKESFKVNSNIIKGLISENSCRNMIKRIDNDNILVDSNIIIVSMFWKNENIPYIMKSIENIRKKNKKAVIYIVGGKSFNEPVPKMVYKSYSQNVDLGNYSFENIPENKIVNINLQKETFIKKQIELNFIYIDIMKTLCNSEKCFILDKNNSPLYYDETHTTKDGAKYIGLSIKNNNIFPSDFYL